MALEALWDHLFFGPTTPKDLILLVSSHAINSRIGTVEDTRPIPMPSITQTSPTNLQWMFMGYTWRYRDHEDGDLTYPVSRKPVFNGGTEVSYVWAAKGNGITRNQLILSGTATTVVSTLCRDNRFIFLRDTDGGRS